MPSGAEKYRGYTVYWDTASAADGWIAKAGALCPPDSFGFCNRIVGITGCQFTSEAEARDYVVRAARRRIDETLTAQQMLGD